MKLPSLLSYSIKALLDFCISGAERILQFADFIHEDVDTFHRCLLYMTETLGESAFHIPRVDEELRDLMMSVVDEAGSGIDRQRCADDNKDIGILNQDDSLLRFLTEIFSELDDIRTQL